MRSIHNLMKKHKIQVGNIFERETWVQNDVGHLIACLNQLKSRHINDKSILVQDLLQLVEKIAAYRDTSLLSNYQQHQKKMNEIFERLNNKESKQKEYRLQEERLQHIDKETIVMKEQKVNKIEVERAREEARMLRQTLQRQNQKLQSQYKNQNRMLEQKFKDLNQKLEEKFKEQNKMFEEKMREANKVEGQKSKQSNKILEQVKRNQNNLDYSLKSLQKNINEIKENDLIQQISTILNDKMNDQQMLIDENIKNRLGKYQQKALKNKVSTNDQYDRYNESILNSMKQVLSKIEDSMQPKLADEKESVSFNNIQNKIALLTQKIDKVGQSLSQNITQRFINQKFNQIIDSINKKQKENKQREQNLIASLKNQLITISQNTNQNQLKKDQQINNRHDELLKRLDEIKKQGSQSCQIQKQLKQLNELGQRKERVTLDLIQNIKDKAIDNIFQIKEKTDRKIQQFCRKLENINDQFYRLSKMCLAYKNRPSLDRFERGRDYDKYLQHFILQNEVKHKEYLIRQIQAKFGEISKTKLLFKMDRLNQANFHKYVDGKANILLIVKINTERYIAAFSNSPFIKYPKYYGESSLLFSIFNERRKTYPLKPQGKAYIYDDYYIIFGNSQISIKNGESKLLSNFARNVASHEPGEDKIFDFLGSSQNQIEFQYYQIYQLQFLDKGYEQYERYEDLLNSKSKKNVLSTV